VRRAPQKNGTTTGDKNRRPKKTADSAGLIYFAAPRARAG